MYLYIYELPFNGQWTNHMHISVLARTEEEANNIAKEYLSKWCSTVVETARPVETIKVASVIYAEPYIERLLDGVNINKSPIYKHELD